ncbi:hypothetical protein ACM01_07020 [Streptomyces viridochromogenes]|uniref:Uncharacterized protein n=1 Tax=Streptomyces viridochromogenes TaxID=1938 RepID=A0A0J8CDL5_STRVR|nr:hypothetical protein [Streptomyces viridochromogenes]KMS75975.1 hypothetical protein ACM01_07020 [Streptomyces viridochromogenes]
MNETPEEDSRKPYVDEGRDTPVRHRYVHGGFAANGTRFSIYLPPDDAYQGRFFQHITPVPSSEHRPPGGRRTGSPSLPGLAGAENTDGVWHGFVPHIIGSPMAIPIVFSVRMHTQRVLRHRLDSIVDALEPGGSGGPYEDSTPRSRRRSPRSRPWASRRGPGSASARWGCTPSPSATAACAQWHLDGDGKFPATEVTPAERVGVERRHAFSSPGTRFVTVGGTDGPDADRTG